MKRFQYCRTTQDLLGLFAIGLLAIGCSSESSPNSQPTPPTFDGSLFLAEAEMDGALEIIQARKSSKNDQPITVVGRIGGSLNPWVDGVAAFSIVDRSLKACSDGLSDGETCSCKTPWDYCCEVDQLKDAMALVKFVQKNGKIVKHDARKLFELSELQTVIVQGKAERDEAGNLTILAAQMHLSK